MKIKTTRKESVNPFISDMTTTTEAPQKTSHVDHGSTTQKSHIIIVVILVIVVFIAGAVICIVYGIFKNPPCRNSSDVSCTTSALSSADSVNKIEHKIKTENSPLPTSPLRKYLGYKQ